MSTLLFVWRNASEPNHLYVVQELLFKRASHYLQPPSKLYFVLRYDYGIDSFVFRVKTIK